MGNRATRLGRYKPTASATIWQALREQLAPLDLGQHHELPAYSVVSRAHAYASRFDLMLYAERRIAGIHSTGGASPSPAALEALRRIIATFVDDNGPAPQVGPTQSGSVEVQWLVNGMMVAAIFESTGDYSLMVMNPSNELILDADVDAGDRPDDDALAFIHQQLTEMKDRITSRPRDFVI